jgi:ABC-type phosphate transport system substrate-binding protein
MKKFLFALLFVAAASIDAKNVQAQLIIVNPSTKASFVAKSELKDIFSGTASSFKDGSHVTPVILKPSAVQEEFLAAFIGKTDAAFRASWRSLVFSGESSMPKQLDSDAAMVDYVAHTPGAIGYIGKGSAHEGVKVLTVK